MLQGLFALYTAVWIGLFVYLLRLTRRTRRVEKEMEALQKAAGPDR